MDDALENIPDADDAASEMTAATDPAGSVSTAPDSQNAQNGRVSGNDFTPPTALDEIPAPGRGAGQAGRKRGPYRPRAGKAKGDAVEIDPQEIAQRRAGEQTARLFMGIIGNFAPGSLPQSDTEKALAGAAISQTGQFFVDSDIADLPPGIALATAWSAYYLTVISAERNREATRSFFGRIKAKISLFRAARKAGAA